MKIALLHYAAPPIVGGVESVIGHHARLMVGAGHAVRVIAARGEPWLEAMEFVHVPLVDSRHPDVLAVKAELDVGRLPDEFARLRDHIMVALRPALAGVELLIAHNVCSLNKNLPLTAALYQLYVEPGFPRLILWHHDLAWTTPRYRPQLHDGYPWELLCTHWAGVGQVVISQLRRRELADLLDMPDEEIRVIPNGVDLGTFLKLETQTLQLVRSLNLLTASPLLLLPVRLTTRKNIELALRVLADLRERLPDVRLVITGPPSTHNPANVDYFARLRHLRSKLDLTSTAHFLAELTDGELPDSIIADFFRLADALFLPSREEGFGIPLLEAAFSHMPIFCADIPALRELGGEEVIYFSPDAEPREIAEVMAARLKDLPTLRFATRARRAFTWEQVYTQHIDPLLKSQTTAQ